MRIGDLSVPAKSALTALGTLLITGALELAWIERGGAPAVAILIVIVVCTAIAWLFATSITRYRLRALNEAFRRMADGELDIELPPAPDADLVPLRESFSRMSSALRALTGELRRLDASRRQLFSDLAHEIGTPTATLVALIDALALPSVHDSEEERAEVVRALVGEGARLSRLIADLRALAELQDPDISIERATFDVGALAREVVTRRALAEEGAAIRVEAAEVIVDADPARVEQVLTNLLANARRYTPADGSIEVHVAALDGAARIRIEDSGAGVPEEMLPLLGERLLRVDPSRSRITGGSGLGLSIVRAIVDRHGGALRFGRARLGGLRVELDLPAAQPRRLRRAEHGRGGEGRRAW